MLGQVRNYGVRVDHFSYSTRTRSLFAYLYPTRAGYFSTRPDPRVYMYPWIISTITITRYNRKKPGMLQYVVWGLPACGAEMEPVEIFVTRPDLFDRPASMGDYCQLSTGS